MLPNPRCNTNHQNRGSSDNSPKLNMPHILVPRRLRRQRHRHQTQHNHQIPARTVVLIQALGPRLAPKQPGRVERQCACQGLDQEDDVDGQAHDGVRRLEVCAVVGGLVVDDYGEAGEQGEDAKGVQRGVDFGAAGFLGRGVCGLEEEDCLGREEEARGVE